MEKIYDPHAIEKKWYTRWIEKEYFAAGKNPSAPSFSMVIPPPNVTGSLHMGHALNNTLQDIVTRFHRMSGYNSLWLPGMDHAGIATQNVVERELAKEGLHRDEVGRDKFIERVWEWKAQSGGTIIEQLKRLGCSCDWSRERFTMDEGLSRAVREVFVRLYKEGLIYRDNDIINWCPRCKTALSDLEAEHEETKGFLYYIHYPLANGDGHLTVATTRPETMLGDTAVAVNPKDPRFGKYVGQDVILPLVGKKIPVIGDSYVDMEFGTGALKVTPAHDVNDFDIMRIHYLEIVRVIDADGLIVSPGFIAWREYVASARQPPAPSWRERGRRQKGGGEEKGGRPVLHRLPETLSRGELCCCDAWHKADGRVTPTTLRGISARRRTRTKSRRCVGRRSPE